MSVWGEPSNPMSIEDIEVVDLADGEVMNAVALNGARRSEPLMPIARTKDGYYPRYREDGTAVPWKIQTESTISATVMLEATFVANSSVRGMWWSRSSAALLDSVTWVTRNWLGLCKGASPVSCATR